MVNVEAQKERHAKLKLQNIPLQNPVTHSFMGGVKEIFSGCFQGLCNDKNHNPLIGKLFKRMAGLTAAFFIVVTLIPSFPITQGFEETLYEEMDLTELAYDESDPTIADVMTEDGFLLKPALNSAEGDRSDAKDIFMYTVQAGDTLSSIAEQFRLKKETLMGENNLWNPNHLRVGSTLRILPVDGLSHKVSKGETLDKIAKKYKVEKETIMKQNQLDEETLLADITLIVPGAKATAPVYLSATAPSSAANYSGPRVAGRLIWPAQGKLTQGYHRRHLAIDIGNRAKGPIYAAASGKVIKASLGWNGGYGNMIIIDHGGGMQTLYGHQEVLYVTEGQYVEQGQTIGWMGRTGRVYGPTGIHLHFEVRIKGVKYNPANFF